MAIRSRSPFEWGWEELKLASLTLGAGGEEEHLTGEVAEVTPLVIRRIGINDLRIALARGLGDFAAGRTDVIFVCLIYPVLGLVLARLAFGLSMLPLVFPLVSGFALLGPLAGVGLAEMSRRRERGASVGWADAFGVLRSPAIGSILIFGLVLALILLAWLVTAAAIYALTLGPKPPASVSAFVSEIFTTGAGWAMIVVGSGAGFLYALLVLAISVVSFPLMLDRHVGVDAAVAASLRAVAVSPGPIALWGLIVAAGLVIGSIPFLVGLAVVLPILGHATWHLYRRVVG